MTWMFWRQAALEEGRELELHAARLQAEGTEHEKKTYLAEITKRHVALKKRFRAWLRWLRVAGWVSLVVNSIAILVGALNHDFLAIAIQVPPTLGSIVFIDFCDRHMRRLKRVP